MSSRSSDNQASTSPGDGSQRVPDTGDGLPILDPATSALGDGPQLVPAAGDDMSILDPASSTPGDGPQRVPVTGDDLPILDLATSAHGDGPLREGASRPVAAGADPLPHAKPSWRGWIHAGTFPVAIVLGVVLMIVADGGRATASAAVFAAASMLLFGISALYHRLPSRPRLTATLQRLDHANIFLLIAGTYTPIALLSLPRAQWLPLLALVWGGAALGIGFRLFWQGAPRWLYVPIYVALGWAAMVYAGALFDAGRVSMTLVVIGGVLYSAGAVVYGLKRPDPLPDTFGFHEIFHLLTVPAFLCHWIAVLLVVTHPPLW